MNRIQDQVREFHRAFEIKEEETPTKPDLQTAALRVELIDEEFKELKEAIAKDDLVGIADALGDLLYVTFGAAISFGIDMEPVVDEIHRSNMSKVGGYKRDDGKWIKPDTYSPAQLVGILLEQRATIEALAPPKIWDN